MQQEERVSILRELKDELLEYRNEFEGYSSYENFDASFRMQDPECRNVKLLPAYDLYISTVLPLEHKKIRYITTCACLRICYPYDYITRYFVRAAIGSIYHP